MKKIRVGTRGSKLALKQAEIVSNLIKEKLGLDSEIISIKTSGDKIQDKPLYDIGGKALFLKEIEEALLDNKIDIAVHSLKDVPGIMPEELEISAMLKREDPSDIFISKSGKTISELEKGSVVGSSSPRRIMYLKKMRPDLDIKPIRGNLDTRISKVMNSEYDGTILAAAGLKRLYGEIDCNISSQISMNEMLPAIGQGVIALEIRKYDEFSRDICRKINHKETFDLVSIERAFLEHVQADCKSPVAGYVRRVEGPKLELNFMLSDTSWKRIESFTQICELKEARKVAIMAAEKLLRKLNENN